MQGVSLSRFLGIALVLFFLLYILCLFIKTGPIQSELRQKSINALAEQGYTLERVSFSGRDAHLYGAVASNADMEKARQSVYNLFGVRVARSHLTTDASLAQTSVRQGSSQLSSAQASAQQNLSSFANCPAQNAQNANALAQDLAKLIAKMPNVRFPVGQVEPTNDYKAYLNEVAAALKHYPNVAVELIGYTDSNIAASANQILSQARVTSVYNYMLSQSINANCLQISAAGQNNPLSTNNTREGRALNRRIEFRVLEAK